MADIINLFGEAVNESVAEAKRTIGSRFVEKAGAEEDEEYNAFTEKFKPKKTTRAAFCYRLSERERALVAKKKGGEQ